MDILRNYTHIGRPASSPEDCAITQIGQLLLQQKLISVSSLVYKQGNFCIVEAANLF